MECDVKMNTDFGDKEKRNTAVRNYKGHVRTMVIVVLFRWHRKHPLSASMQQLTRPLNDAKLNDYHASSVKRNSSRISCDRRSSVLDS